MAVIGEMAGGVAHEINSPLTAILMNAERMARWGTERAPEGAEVVKRANAIVHICHRIATIIQGLKLFSGDSEGEAEKSFLLQGAILNTLDLCREKFKANGIEMSFQQSDPKLVGVGDPVQFSRVLINVLENAFDAVLSVNEKWVRINVEGKKDLIEIYTSDSGRGIPKDIAEKIFEPFFTTKDIRHGAGLGLCASRGMMKRHGGDLTYDSTCPNTRFVMTLRRSNESA
jgi:C4-dicarboxylate-specific signal transduction histidine kinase